MRGRRSAAATAVGSTFPGYANVAELASGAFATVYKAVELGTGRPVALKVLRLADTSPHLVEVFEKELGALALLSNHPNVTTLYGTFSTPEGRPVLVLELCRQSLAHRVRQSGPLAAGDVVQVGIKIAGALETAHRSGLLHRDMKPQNILVSQFDEPVLADFGVATLQAQAQSTEGVFGFTTLHAPPEALEGLPLSPSADIYGLASSMYQLLVGRGPFSSYEGEAPASVILRILRDPAPRAPANDVPVALADLMENALAKDPGKRPQTAGAFAEALREIESLAGWPQTPYVVWGSSQAGPPPSEGALAPGAPNPAPKATAARLADLLRAESARVHRLPDPATEPETGPVAQVTPQAPAPVAVAAVVATAVVTQVEEPGSVALAAAAAEPAPANTPAARQAPATKRAPATKVVPAARQAPVAKQKPPAKQAPAAAGPSTKARGQSSRSPKRAAEQPPAPGTRSVIAPPPQQRNVLGPLPAAAQVRVVAPAEPVTPVSSWLTPLTATVAAPEERQWPSPIADQTSRRDAPRPGSMRPARSEGWHLGPLEQAGASRRRGRSGAGLHAAQSSSRRKEALVATCALGGGVIVAGGIAWAALAHLL